MAGDLSTALFEKLQMAIIKGDYPAGSKLPAERVLAEIYGVSRITVRDAVSKLAQMGLVTISPQRGTFVKDIKSESSLDLLIHIMQATESVDSDILISLLELRRMGEGLALRNAVNKADEEDLRELRQIVDDAEKHLFEPDLLAESDHAFHFGIVSISRNPVAQLLFNSFWPVYKYYTNYFYRLDGAARQALDNHRRLVDAMESRDVSYAEYVLEQTLIYGENRVKEALNITENSEVISLSMTMPPYNGRSQ